MIKPIKNNRLGDILHFFIGNIFAVSESLKDFLEKKIENLEFLPITILNHDKQEMFEPYFVVHIYKHTDCLDHIKSEPTYNPTDPSSVMSLKREVIDESKIEKGAKLFRIKDYEHDVFLTKKLKDELVDAGFTGFSFRNAKR